MTQNQLRYFELQEQKRHNQTTESQTDRQLAEAARHNVSLESETNRHNIETEHIQQQANTINHQHYTATDAELVRHNVATETEAIRHNVVSESETNRHNLVTESTQRFEAKTEADIEQQKVDVQKAAQTETQRHNIASENTNAFTAANNAINQDSQTRLNKAKVITEGTVQVLNKTKSDLNRTQTFRAGIGIASDILDLFANARNVGKEFMAD